MRHTIQVGAFADLDNAARFTESLQAKGINAYHFRDETGLYKVRFGNYPSRTTARNVAENLLTIGLIEDLVQLDRSILLLGRPGWARRPCSGKWLASWPMNWGSESLL